MSPRLPRVTARQVISVLEKLGFHQVRQSGSHKIFRNDGIRVTVPLHGNEILHPKVVRSILADVGLTVEEFQDLL
jgi:predicted RNA binding protein YcfA (HicA-like mRNA interferase family)